MTFKSIYPYTQEIIAEYPLMNEGTISRCIALAEKAFPVWSKMSFAEKAKVFSTLSSLLKERKETLGALITNEMGKVIAESIAEVEKCAYVCDYYAEHAEQFLKDEVHEAGYKKSFVAYEPIGAVLGIMPWNFPFWQVFRYAAPTLMAGNVTLLKHAGNVSGCAKAIEQLFLDAGAPKGAFQSLIIQSSSVEKILSANIIQAATLTGSEKAGSAVASIAGKNIKKTVLELGGSDPLIVLPDADMKKAAATALQSRMQNAGQSCIGAKRFIVLKDALNDFMQEVNLLVKNFVQGDPFDTAIKTGPMARIDLVEALQKQLNESIASGAHLVFGGEADGCNFKPAILMDVKKGMPAFEEETFGPLATVIEAQDEQEAIQLANVSELGLGGSVWTADIDKGIAIARKIQSGAVFINSLVKSDPRLPFGGIKKSGYGRELGRHGILEFVNAKTIAVDI